MDTKRDVDEKLKKAGGVTQRGGLRDLPTTGGRNVCCSQKNAEPKTLQRSR